MKTKQEMGLELVKKLLTDYEAKQLRDAKRKEMLRYHLTFITIAKSGNLTLV